MIPFEKTLPYDIIMGDVYVHECPYCNSSNVLLPIKPRDIQHAREGKKKLLVFPCCGNKVTILDSDADYLLTDTVLRRS
ncbi:hypothetical protein J25TS5_26930 [Paenibacillus faecis]|uniref:Uncharacterized protein n=1 Tax=Paenibacillus faecis TaxID=862114 RepID=A0A5D0CZG4_9BACL|nr:MULTISPECIES: hypothetical protein [Paenibacillus]MCA1293891.1 hypothetical protein [Paenibacillus sp. alder61]TYA15469.1 hypothetical protein FRY98_07560 [Paenibacillus faecis]GIO85761.1 hypothetical protein J25TS5_26930 [Paenibacillus faecis]